MNAKFLFSGRRIRAAATQQLFFLLHLFVVMTEVVGGRRTGGGVGAGSVLFYFRMAFGKNTASHVARFLFLLNRCGVCVAEGRPFQLLLDWYCPTLGAGWDRCWFLSFFFSFSFFAGTTGSCLDASGQMRSDGVLR